MVKTRWKSSNGPGVAKVVIILTAKSQIGYWQLLQDPVPHNFNCTICQFANSNFLLVHVPQKIICNLKQPAPPQVKMYQYMYVTYWEI